MSKNSLSLLQALQMITSPDEHRTHVRIIPSTINNGLREILESIYVEYGVEIMDVSITKLIDWAIKYPNVNLESLMYIDIIIPNDVDMQDLTTTLQPFVKEFYIFQTLQDDINISGRIHCSLGIYSYGVIRTANGYETYGDFYTLHDVKSAAEFANDLLEMHIALSEMG